MRISQAIAKAQALVNTPWKPIPEDQITRQTFVAIGDPQAPLQTFFSILDRHNLLGEDGFLRKEVFLVSMGDHFDYHGKLEDVREQGEQLLRWLAEHPPDQITLLAGNHDLCRVVELVKETDESFARAQKLGNKISNLYHNESEKEAKILYDEFCKTFHSIPNPKIPIRDFLSFSERQKTLVKKLLLAKRFQLAKSVFLEKDTPILLTHAGVTLRELSLLDLKEERNPNLIAKKLNHFLFDAVKTVRTNWEQGKNEALTLEPLSIRGKAKREGGGFLYHRPSNPEHTGADPAWDFDKTSPRRFHPNTLPLGLVQACGHTGHSKCLKILDGFVSLSAKAQKQGGLRTLCYDGKQIIYESGISPYSSNKAMLYMLDGEMNRVPVEEYPLFFFTGV